MKKKHYIGIIAIILFLGSALTLPAFIYNELENQTRFRFLQAQQVADFTDRVIDAKRGVSNVAMSDQDRETVDAQVLSALEGKQKLIAQNSVDYVKQDKIPFLPRTYRHYHAVKTAAMTKYAEGSAVFLRVKKIEAKGYDASLRLAQCQNLISVNEDTTIDMLIKNIREASLIAQKVDLDADTFFTEGTVDEGFRDFLKDQARVYRDLAGLMENILVNNQVPPDFYSQLAAIKKKSIGYDKEIISTWHKEIIDGPKAQFEKLMDEAFDEMGEADKYFKDNDLKSDPLSRFLSKFSDRYPKNI